jgi:hypothetical protein
MYVAKLNVFAIPQSYTERFWSTDPDYPVYPEVVEPDVTAVRKFYHLTFFPLPAFFFKLKGI